jgi:hypothetical protein
VDQGTTFSVKLCDAEHTAVPEASRLARAVAARG